MLLFDTKRQYHEKKEQTIQKLKMDGYPLTIIGKDFWVGPSSSEERGFWQRGIYFDNR